MKGTLGKKVGMTQVYDAAGTLVPVTVLAVEPCVVLGLRIKARHGYSAIQLGGGNKQVRNTSKAIATLAKNAGYVDSAPAWIREIRYQEDPKENVGDSVTVAIFKPGDYVDVTGTTKGRGFQGVVKRHRFSGGRASHGGGWIRRTGSVGMKEHPGRIYPGRRMPGHMGNVRRTVQNLKVVQVRTEDKQLLVEGAVPGANGGFILVKHAIKKHHGN